MRTALRRAAPVLVAVVVLAPALRDPGSDSYPLSTYPMFADNRPADAHLATVVGVRSDGTEKRLSPELIAGSDEVILAAATVADAVRRGEAALLCAEVAARVGDELTEVVVRTEHIDVVAHVATGAPPLEIIEHSRCAAGS